jgi:hypothetical protein
MDGSILGVSGNVSGTGNGLRRGYTAPGREERGAGVVTCHIVRLMDDAEPRIRDLDGSIDDSAGYSGGLKMSSRMRNDILQG